MLDIDPKDKHDTYIIIYKGRDCKSLDSLVKNTLKSIQNNV